MIGFVPRSWFTGAVFCSRLIKPDPFHAVVARHVRKNYRVAFLEPFEHHNVVHRGAPYFDRHARSPFAVGIELEQAQRRVLVAQAGRPT